MLWLPNTGSECRATRQLTRNAMAGNLYTIEEAERATEAAPD